MTTIGTSINTNLDGLKKNNDTGLQVQTNSSSLNVKQDKNAEMELMTKEGDKVTLTFTSQASAGYSNYDQTGRMGDTSWSTSMKSAYAETETNISIKIEGDLNKEELRDIMKAAKKLEKAMNKLVNGNADGAVDSLLDAAKGHTISSMESTLSYSRSIEMEKQYQSLSMPELPEQLVPEETPTPELPPPTQQEQIINNQDKIPEKSQIEKLLDDVKDAVKKSRIPVLEIKPSFENFFDRMIEKAEKNTLKESGITDLFRKLRKDLMSELLPDNKKVSEVEV